MHEFEHDDPETLGEAREYVVVTPEGPEDGGDFGKNTPGTKTAGIQEAFDHVHDLRLELESDRAKNVYISRGYYPISETLRIPWLGEEFRFDARDTHISYTQPTGDGVVIDSQMNSRFTFGYVSALTLEDGWVVRLDPKDPGPSIGLPEGRVSPILTLNEINFNAVVVRGMPQLENPEAEVRGNGVLLDATAGPIIWCKVFIHEVNTANVGVQLSGNCGANWVDAPFMHGCATSLVVGETGAEQRPTDNRIDMTITNEWIPGCAGARIGGERNLVTLTVYRSEPGQNVIFEPDAKDNIVHGTLLPDGITNNATTPTNRVIPCEPVGFGVGTPNFPAPAQAVVNRHPYLVEAIILTPGAVSEWTLTDAKGCSQTVTAALSAGERFLLEPGDAIEFDYPDAYSGCAFTYEPAPTWKWRALR